MKKLITVTALTLLMAITTSAQQRNGGMKKGPDFTAEQIATIQTKKMALALDLDETQQKAIYKTFQTAATNRKAAMENFKQKRAAGTKPTSEERFEMDRGKTSAVSGCSSLDQRTLDDWHSLKPVLAVATEIPETVMPAEQVAELPPGTQIYNWKEIGLWQFSFPDGTQKELDMQGREYTRVHGGVI